MSTALNDLQEFAAILKVLPPSDKARVIGELHRMLDEQEAAKAADRKAVRHG